MLISTKLKLAAALVAAVALLVGLRQPSPREVVTHKICYTDVSGNRTCE